MLNIFGNKKEFAIEYEILDLNVSRDVFGYINLWLNDSNICQYTGSEVEEWNIYYIIEWFCDKLEYILGYDAFPLPVTGNTSLELLRKADEYENDNQLKSDLWYFAKSRWIFNHSWFTARDGAILPCVYFRRVKDCIEISWDNKFWQEYNIRFSSVEGFYLVNFSTFTSILSNFLNESIIDLEKKLGYESIKDMRKKINILFQDA